MVRQLIPYLNFQHEKFAAPLKTRLATILDVHTQHIETYKDQEYPLLKRVDGKTDTLRQALIADSEDFLKQRYGNDIFGRLAVQRMFSSAHSLILFSDCGFQPEVEHVIRAVGRSNCLLIRMHREGRTYEHDSRSYLPNGMCTTVDVHNDDIVHNVAMRCLRHIMKNLQVKLLKEPELWVK